MSQINELINKFCPNGVEYSCFDENCQFIRGLTYSKSHEVKSNKEPHIKVLRANNITVLNNCLNLDNIKYISTECHIKNTQWLKKNDILMCIGSGSKEHIGKVAYITQNMPYSFGGFMAVIRCNDNLNSRYMFYILTSELFTRHLEHSIKSTTINNINKQIMSSFYFPLPPVEVQQEIVRLLDKFSQSTIQLIDLLSKELIVRKKQYDYYRDKLFENDEPINKVKLSTLCDIYDGTHQTPQYTQTGIPFVSVENITNLYATKKYVSHEAYAKYKVKPKIGDVFMTRIGTIGKCTVVSQNNDLAYYVSLALLRPKKDSINSDYLKYYIESTFGKRELNKWILWHAVPIKINKNDIGKIMILIPSLEEQARLVSLLSRFDTLYNNLTYSIATEIKAHQQQYEYYRDKLLSFEWRTSLS